MLWLLLVERLHQLSGMRALCVVVLMGWILGPLVGVGIIVALISDVAVRIEGAGRIAILLLALAVLCVIAAATVLLYIPACARCGKRLFSDAKLFQPQRDPLQDRDYRARQFFWSYRNGAILSMAWSGQLRCQWCGHRVGDTPDYVVISGA